MLSVVLKVATGKDAEKWNSIVEKGPQSTFFDRFEWVTGLGVISKRVKPLPLFIEIDGEVASVFPSCLIASPLRNTLESLPFSEYGGGPLFRNRDHLMNINFSKKFYDSIVQIGNSNNCLKISVRRAYLPNLVTKDFVGKPVITDTDTCTFIINLTEGIDKLLKKTHPKRRCSIRQARERGTSIYEASSHSDLETYYDIYLQTMDRLKSAPLPFQFYSNIWNTFAPRNEAKIFIAEYNSRPIGGVLLLIFGGVCNAYSSATLYEYQDKRPNDYLIWHSIKWATENNLRVFDFGSTPNDPKSGHYQYKQKWGGQHVTLYTYHLILQPNWWKCCRLGYSLIKKARNILQ